MKEKHTIQLRHHVASTRRSSLSAPASHSPGESGFGLRIAIGLFIVVADVCLGLAGVGASWAAKDPLVPNGFDCSKIHELGIAKQMSFRAGAIMIACGQAQGGGTSAASSTSPLGALTQFVKKLFSPLAYGGTDVDLITGETFPDLQSTTFSWGNPDNPDQI